MQDEPKTVCRTPTDGRDGVTRIPTWKYEAIRAAILGAVDEAGPEGLPFGALAQEVSARLEPELRARLGSVPWHVTSVKLNMEVEGEIARLPGRGPQRLVRAG